MKNNEAKKSISNSLIMLRKASGLSQLEIGLRLDIDQSSYSRIESGQRELGIYELKRVCEIYSISIDSFLSSKINYFNVAKYFNKEIKIDSKYLNLKHSRIRELLPFVYLANEN